MHRDRGCARARPRRLVVAGHSGAESLDTEWGLFALGFERVGCVRILTGYPVTGYPGRRTLLAGHAVPVEGCRFPHRIAAVIELQGAAILHALRGIERGHRTPQDVRRERDTARAVEKLKEDTGAGTKWSRPLDERTARTDIDERHRVAGAQDRLSARNHGLRIAGVDAPVD